MNQEFHDLELVIDTSPCKFTLNKEDITHGMRVEVLWTNGKKSKHTVCIREIQRHFYYKDDDYPYIVNTPFITVKKNGEKFDMMLEATSERTNPNIKLRIVEKST